ncbi:hypothetical protein BO83DRAFT_210682 [Aspergillus eucalypticola CBS 122712]|uniref:Uncharacterized protein n=1 Tax=Aspergillus eucalypticola (strain CBS 122712 / IBT 29274) TaxID=1448314 RepID=A0A317UKF2_ASPEC|nr:uncharacterized protein BO83DRAFT_210682 [Aspergillus eucalypticola CBS 122712]PWY61819.1 hypothetical protein BO83DRAFT_210682 [Aspergillus eucalypticola CBS 122712]
MRVRCSPPFIPWAGFLRKVPLLKSFFMKQTNRILTGRPVQHVFTSPSISLNSVYYGAQFFLSLFPCGGPLLGPSPVLRLARSADVLDGLGCVLFSIPLPGVWDLGLVLMIL